MSALDGLDTARGHSLVPSPEEAAVIPKLYGTDGKPFAHKTIYLRYFTLTGAQWLIAECDAESWLMFGYCDLGLGFPEWGYVDLHELATLSVRIAQGLPLYVERDLAWIPRSFARLDKA